MPTGYTDAVQSGKITELPAFAMRCARNFGALISLRDQPWDAPIPERVEPYTKYHDEALAEAEARLVDLRAMSLSAIREAAQQAYAERVKVDDDHAAEKRGWRQRYEAMLAQVEAWEPPTPDHVGLKAFMVQQLQESIRCDCPERAKADQPVKLEPDQWHAREVERAEWERSYHTQKIAEEIARTEQRNRWLSQLRSSLALTPAE